MQGQLLGSGLSSVPSELVNTRTESICVSDIGQISHCMSSMQHISDCQLVLGLPRYIRQEWKQCRNQHNPNLILSVSGSSFYGSLKKGTYPN